jgi:hypothetical protein
VAVYDGVRNPVVEQINRRVRVRALVPWLIAMLAVACGGRGESASDTANGGSVSASDTPGVAVQTEPRDSAIVEQRLEWARGQRLDTLPIGAIVARFGRTFVGAPYVPGSLEVPPTEQLVLNLREFDCVTFVESMLALARVLRAGGGYPEFTREMVRIRYRDGVLAGYPSRLHYFSEWIADNDAKGVVRSLTQTLGGVRDPEPIRFMTTHPEAYRQLGDPAVLSEIQAMEQRLNAEPRFYIPESGIAAAADRIQDGDVIAAASTLPGLDIAHTGLALWVDGRLHLMHAPLVGRVVEISQQPLAERIKSIATQDGIMVARPLLP